MTDDDKALVERLRAWKSPWRGDGDENTIPLAAEAANYIETQAAEIERLRNLVYLFVDPFDVTPEDEDFVQAAQRAALKESK